MHVRNRGIEFWGSVASIISLMLALGVFLFSSNKVASLASLIIFESIVILLWVFYNRSRLKMLFPYDWEETLRYERYFFSNQNHIRNETISVIRVTTPALTHIPVEAYWTGLGEISIFSNLHAGKFDYDFDVKSGALSFSYPLGATKRFGDSAVMHYLIDMIDKGGENLPYFSVGITRPTELLVVEVVLAHVETSLPAAFGYLHMDESRGVLHLNDVQSVNFDAPTRTYRIAVANPVMGRRYRLNWQWQ